MPKLDYRTNGRVRNGNSEDNVEGSGCDENAQVEKKSFTTDRFTIKNPVTQQTFSQL